MAHCLNLLHIVLYRILKEQPQIGDTGSNPVAINQFLILFLLGLHVLVLFFHFHLHFIFSLFYVAYFI